MELNILLDLAAIIILLVITAFSQTFLKLPKGSWYGMLVPSLPLFCFTRVVFHYVYYFKLKFDDLVAKKIKGQMLIKGLSFASNLLPYITLFTFCYLVLSMNSSIAGNLYNYIFNTLLWITNIIS